MATTSRGDTSGACMCGAIQFSFTGEHRFVAECVCRSCRVAHGASAVAWLGVNNDQFRIDTGHNNLKWYQSSAASERGFCSECGTRLFFRSTRWAGETHMTLANLHDPDQFKSRGISFAEETPAWTCLAASAPAG